jgi:hypothetical protein
MSDCQRDPRRNLSGDQPYHGESYVCDMSLGLCCAGVELGGGGRRWGEGQVETCYVDGPGVVKGGREV